MAVFKLSMALGKLFLERLYMKPSIRPAELPTTLIITS